MPQPTSKPGQPGGNHGPARPTYFPLCFSSTTNMPAPCNAQCPAITAALRQPANSLVMGFPSTVMNRAVRGSASIAVFGATSVPRHCRRISRSVSITGPFDWASVTPGLRGAIILNFHFHGRRLLPYIRISGGKRGPYHPCQIRLAIRLGEQQHTGIEMTVVDDDFVGITRGEQYFQRGPALQRCVGELAAVHRARH